MKRFNFALEALLEMRKRGEEAVKLELARKNNEIYTAKGALGGLEDDLKELQADQKKARGTVSDVLSLRSSVSYRNKLKGDILRKGQNIQELQRQLGLVRVQLIKATQKKKAIELIRKKRYNEWLKEQKHKEQDFIDEVSQQGFIRKKRTAKNFSAVS